MTLDEGKGERIVKQYEKREIRKRNEEQYKTYTQLQYIPAKKSSSVAVKPPMAFILPLKCGTHTDKIQITQASNDAATNRT